MQKNLINHNRKHKIKVLTNFWLITLSTIVGLTVLCCATLVGWPIVAHLADKIVG